jgi:hypothetical protein
MARIVAPTGRSASFGWRFMMRVSFTRNFFVLCALFKVTRLRFTFLGELNRQEKIHLSPRHGERWDDAVIGG